MRAWCMVQAWAMHLGCTGPIIRWVSDRDVLEGAKHPAPYREEKKAEYRICNMYDELNYINNSSNNNTHPCFFCWPFLYC